VTAVSMALVLTSWEKNYHPALRRVGKVLSFRDFHLREVAPDYGCTEQKNKGDRGRTMSRAQKLWFDFIGCRGSPNRGGGYKDKVIIGFLISDTLAFRSERLETAQAS
jgi:hypothetical protein